ncbi:excinuclease ABC subunit UvrC, partial [Candidatus Saccharibacteria bacterium]|nr:excinuclease ABC subunit UvrC [Candidatus Saccharibacteria bacterium]
MNKQLEVKLKELPKSPGVYFHKDASGEIIYVGKAAVLRSRVRQYFQKSRARDPKTEALVAEIVDTDWMVVESELEALFLEAEMIRRYMPRYNILLRDDKAMSYIRIDYDSDYPTVSTTRRPLDDGARYFGPYFSVYGVRQALKLLRRIFPFATRKVAGQKRASLHYHLGMDPGLEEGKTSLQDYRANLRKLIAVIEGKRAGVIKEVERDMKRASKAQDYELAARYRNQLMALQNLGKQVIFSDKEFLDISKDQALVQLQTVLGLAEPPKRIEGYDVSHMSGTNVVASMVVFTNGVSNKGEYRKFKTSQRNDDYANMRETLTRRFSETNQKAWGMPSLVLIDGGPGQLAATLDAMEEQGVFVPAVSVAKREEELVVHATRSHVDTAYLDKLVRQPIDGVEARLQGGYYYVNLHVGQSNAGAHSKNLRGGTTLSPYTDTVKLIQRIRDESHRFAVSYHSSLKVKQQTASILDDIPTIGPATRKKLIKTFGSMRGVAQARDFELEKVVG